MADSKDKIWDMTFKTLFQETPALFLPLIEEVFHVKYRKEDIIPLDHSLYNGDGDLVKTDNAFSARGVTYHFEFQYTNDGTMAFRMWEYDVKLALRDYKRNENRMEFNFPKSCVVYIARNGNYPKDGLELKINFQDGQHIVFRVPTIRMQDYGLDVINSKKLWLFYPFMALQFAADMKGRKHLSEQEVLANYREMIDSIETAYNNDEMTIDENTTLLETIRKTNQHTMKKHLGIMEGVEKMVSQTLELKHKQIRREAAAAAAAAATRETEREMLMTMKITGISRSAIIKVAQRVNIPEEEVNKILDDQE
ncbi:MAG: hypothetical protein NC121_10550 [Blautia sp.]|nr:hypothetical protein [Blautia sp.]